MGVAALAAGAAAHAIYAAGVEVRLKADLSPVTAADEAAEALILEHLARLAPVRPVVAEEQVAAGRVPPPGESFFLVDPLDGTKEFIARRGDYTVNIALVRAGAPALGVVYAPVSDTLYLGDVRRGRARRRRRARAADARDEPIHARPPPAHGLTAVVSRSHCTPETEDYLRHFAIAERVSVGSALKFCLVAAGEADLYPRLGPTMEWDTAAGQAVLEAAGGRVLDAAGGPFRYGKPGYRNGWFVACGPQLAPAPLSPAQPPGQS